MKESEDYPHARTGNGNFSRNRRTVVRMQSKLYNTITSLILTYVQLKY